MTTREQPNEKLEPPSPTAEALFGDNQKEEQEKKTAPREKPIPQVSLLQSIERNMFFDAAIKSWGYVFLGVAFQRNPDLNDPSKALDVTFEPETHNNTWQNYKCCSIPAIEFELSKLTSNFENGVEAMAKAARKVLKLADGRLVAGTLRAHVTMTQNATTDAWISISLVWIEQIKE